MVTGIGISLRRSFLDVRYIPSFKWDSVIYDMGAYRSVRIDLNSGYLPATSV